MKSRELRHRSRETAEKTRLAHEAEAGASGALAGGILGAAAGPAGIVAGAIIGGAVGTIVGAVLESESSRQASHSRTLDAQIGVSEGDLGAPNLHHPVAKIGAYSAASVGVDSSSHDEPAEGPIQAPET
jgi:phage tail tape-measure protein